MWTLELTAGNHLFILFIYVDYELFGRGLIIAELPPGGGSETDPPGYVYK